MVFLKKCVQALLLLGCFGGVSLASAANVVYISTDEVTVNGPGGIDLMNNVYNALAANPDVVLHDLRGGLAEAGSSPHVPDFGSAELAAADIIVAVTIYGQMHASKLAMLDNIMLNEPDKALLIFSDGCCSEVANFLPLIEVLNGGSGWSMQSSDYIQSTVNSLLNTNSPFSAGFSHTTIAGNHYRLFNNVPGENALYLASGASLPTLTERVSAFGFLVPQRAMNDGQGACTFVVGDASPFTSEQTPLIINDFLRAATDPEGACKRTSGAPDLTPSIASAGAATEGASTTVTIQVRNISSLTHSTNGILTLTLPIGVRLAAHAVLPSFCMELPGATPTTAQLLQCVLPGITAGESTNFPLQLVADVADNYSLEAVITDVADENVSSNNTAAYYLVVSAKPVLVPTAIAAVPTNSGLMLLVLGGLLALFGRRQLAKKRSVN